MIRERLGESSVKIDPKEDIIKRRKLSAEAILEFRLNEAIDTAEVFEEGTRAIILEIDAKALSPKMLAYLGVLKHEEGQALAGKVFKVFVKADAETELGLQAKSFDLIKAQPEQSELAGIPRIYFQTDISLNDLAQLKEKLNRLNMPVADKAQIILMDFIEGEDLMTYFYRRLLSKHPGSRFFNSPDSLKNLRFGTLEPEVAALLSFKSTQSGEAPEQIVLKDNYNRKLLINSLAKYGISLPDNIFKQVANTLTVLGRNGIAHNDVHERNIILTFDEQGEVNGSYLIDFGSGLEGENIPSVSEQLTVLNEYKKLNIIEDTLSQKAKSFLELKKRYVGKLADKDKKTDWKIYETTLLELLNGKNGETLERVVSSCYVNNREDFIAALLLNLSNKSSENKAKIIELLSKAKFVRQPQFWSDLRQILERS